MLSIDTGNSPVQPPVDIFSSPFNAGGAVLLDVFVRFESGVAFENEVNVFDGVTFGALVCYRFHLAYTSCCHATGNDKEKKQDVFHGIFTCSHRSAPHDLHLYQSEKFFISKMYHSIR